MKTETSETQIANATLLSAVYDAGSANITLTFDREVISENKDLGIAVTLADGTQLSPGDGEHRDILIRLGPCELTYCLGEAPAEIDRSQPAMIFIPEECRQVRSALGGRVNACAMFIGGWQQ